MSDPTAILHADSAVYIFVYVIGAFIVIAGLSCWFAAWTITYIVISTVIDCIWNWTFRKTYHSIVSDGQPNTLEPVLSRRRRKLSFYLGLLLFIFSFIPALGTVSYMIVKSKYTYTICTIDGIVTEVDTIPQERQQFRYHVNVSYFVAETLYHSETNTRWIVGKPKNVSLSGLVTACYYSHLSPSDVSFDGNTAFGFWIESFVILGLLFGLGVILLGSDHAKSYVLGNYRRDKMKPDKFELRGGGESTYLMAQRPAENHSPLDQA